MDAAPSTLRQATVERLDPTTGRLPALDGLRGIAVLLVVVSHVSSYQAEEAGPTGVSIFFVLSGFLITSLLLAERDRRGGVDLRAFYTRRALRLFPALFLLVAATPVVLWLADDPRLSQVTDGLLTALFYVQDFASGTGHPGVLGHAWSLSVEEQFYLIWPLALAAIALATRANPRRFASAVSLLAGLALIWHLVDVLGASLDWTSFGPDANAVFLLVGCALAAHRRAGRRLTLPGWAASAALALVLVGPLVLTHVEAGHWRIQALLIFPVCLAGLPLVMGAARLPVLALPVLRWFGTISYGLYLWNWLLISLQPSGQGLGSVQRLAAAIASVGAAAASWYLMEKPVLRLKHRFERVSLGTVIAAQEAVPEASDAGAAGSAAAGAAGDAGSAAAGAAGAAGVAGSAAAGAQGEPVGYSEQQPGAIAGAVFLGSPPPS